MGSVENGERQKREFFVATVKLRPEKWRESSKCKKVVDTSATSA